MKQILLCFFSLFFLADSAWSQNTEPESIPSGKYETVLKGKEVKWEKGDIIIIDETHYRLSTSNEVGSYRYSVTAQRIFFTSGPLKTIFAKTTVSGNQTAIVLPSSENKKAGVNLPVDVYGYLRH